MKNDTGDKAEPLSSAAWDRLPRLYFTRASAPSAAEEERQTDVAYGVRSADRLAVEFLNRKQRLIKVPSSS